MTNETIADQLRRHAAELARGGDNLYRVRAFRQAALTVLSLPEPVTDILAARGRTGLADVPGIGRSLAEVIDVYARTGEWRPREGTSGTRVTRTPARMSAGSNPKAVRPDPRANAIGF